jgi:hypothetical protein
MVKKESSISGYPVVRSECKGIPIYTYGYTFVLSESPDLLISPTIQLNNNSPITKVHPKKSWEISSCQLGIGVPRTPRMPKNDYLPLESINLIDGDAETCWSSRTQSQSDVEPVWIRIDLPLESEISKIILRKRGTKTARKKVGCVLPSPGAVEVGMAMPAEITIKLSCDAWHWNTIYSGDSGDSPNRSVFTFSFKPCRAKQIWIIGKKFPKVENWLFSFSIAEVEIYDTNNENVALASHGTGVEQEKGRLTIDPETDQAVTDLVEHGVDVVMALGFGNRLYTEEDPARKMPQLWEWYYENPKPPATPKALEAWGRYVRFIAEHFRDRVRYFEIWNEWNIMPYWGDKPNLDQYIALTRIAIKILRELCPKSKIVLGSYAGFCYGISGWNIEELKKRENEDSFIKAVCEFARDVDVIAWHPYYQPNPESPNFLNYAEDVSALKKYCSTKGFTGEYMVTEYGFGANYPKTAGPDWWGEEAFSEMEKAKYVAQVTVQHAALGIVSFFNELWTSTYPLDISLLRRTFGSDPIVSQQPQPAYYVLRNLATALEDLQPSNLSYSIRNSSRAIESYAMKRDNEEAIALWLKGRTSDICKGEPCEVIVDTVSKEAAGYDPLNGTSQYLSFSIENNRTILKNILIKDYPIIIRLKH